MSCTSKSEKNQKVQTHNFKIPTEKAAVENIDWRVQSEGGVDFITYIDTASNLYLFDVMRNRVVDTVKLQMSATGIDFNYYPRRVCYHSKDSIFVLPDGGSRSIFMVNARGEIERKWDIDLKVDYPYILSAYRSNPVYFEKNKLFIGLIPRMNEDTDRNTIFSIPPDIALNIKNDSTLSIGQWPEHYKTESYSDGTPERIALTSKDGVKIIYSYKADHHLYISNEKGSVKKRTARSSYIDHFDPYPEDSSNNIAYRMRYLQTTPQYRKILYNSQRKEYYRVALHRTNYIDKETNRKKRGFDQPWSIIVLDSTFEKIDEVKFDPDEYRAGPLLMTSEGLWIPRTSENGDFYNYSFSNFNQLR